MTSPRPRSGPGTHRQQPWLCWLLLACLLGLQVHAPGHALGQTLKPGGEITLLPWDAADRQAAPDAAHGHSPVSDCCPAGLLALSQSAPAAAAYPATPAAPPDNPPRLADSPAATPYQSRAPPV